MQLFQGGCMNNYEFEKIGEKMNFQNIEYFLAVVECGNFTKAAKNLYISQQSLSENIRRLEDEVGTPLLVRGKTLSLTPAGKCFVSGGQKILKTQDKMLREIAVISDTYRCKIVLEVPSCDVPPFLPQVLGQFSQKFPEYEVTINSSLSYDVPDLIFTCDAPDKNSVAIPLIQEDPPVIVFGKLLISQIYGTEWSSVLDAFRHEPLLAHIGRLPILLLQENKHLHPYLSAIFTETDFVPAEGFKSEDANLLSSLCMTGSGAMIAPQDYCLRKFGPLLDAETGSLFMIPLQTSVKTTLNLVYPKNKHLNQAEKRFVGVLQSVLGA